MYDFSRAFDKINYEILINRMYDLCFHQDFIEWIKDYLKDRTQRIRIGSATSDITQIPSGVPQGSHLGPFLFCIYISTLTPLDINKNTIRKFADDTCLAIPFNDNIYDIIPEHNNILNWSNTNNYFR